MPTATSDAREFAEVVTGLWHGKFDGGSGHDGQSFSVRDPLDLPRSPQGAPVMVQPGPRMSAAIWPPGPPMLCSPRRRHSRKQKRLR